MKTAYGRLTLLAFVLALGMLLFAPMRSGVEDSLLVSITRVDMQPGETVAVSYELRAESAQTVAYESDNASVASVDQQGNITAVSPGKTKVRVLAQGGASAVIDVQVAGVPVTSFALNVERLEMNKGDVSGLSYQFNRGAAAQNVFWESANPEIVRVDAAGRLSAVGAGETVITATTSGGLRDSAVVHVNVRANAVEIAPGELIVGVGATFRLNAVYLPSDATDAAAKWTSSAPQVLSVDENGMARAISTGTAVVTVTTRDGLTATAAIVVEPSSKGFQLNPQKAVIEKGSVYELEAMFIGDDGEADENVKHHIEWTSSDPEIVSVQDGLITGHASGVAEITAKADGFESTSSVRVQTSVREVQLNVTEQTLYKEQTAEPFQIRATVIPLDADDQKLTYTSDNPLVATVSQAGLVTMTGGYGSAVITVEAESGAKATCTVNVIVSGME